MWLTLPRTALLAALPLWTALYAGRTGAAPIATAGILLTAQDWDETVKHGTWLIEHYSPYCSHCKSFAPTWKELVDTYTDAASAHDFHFAQVDCAANGDLCRSNDVKYYPSIFLYTKGGKHVEEYEDKRSLEKLGQYVEEHYPVKAETLEQLKEAGRVGTQKEEEWSAKEDEVDQQVGMGERKQAGVALGKASLPKVVDDDAEPSSSSASSSGDDDDASAAPKAVAAAGIVTSQTPPAADPTGTAPVSKFSPPAFVAQQPAPLEKKRTSASSAAGWPAIDGTVLELDNETGLRLVEEDDAPPSFVKYFAPWCSHCKAMAPAWAKLADELASAGVRVYQMDCDAKANKKACKLAKVQSYPTLKFYNAGASVEYLGKRETDEMKTFAQKAMSATSIKNLVTESELHRAVQDDQVVVVLMQPKDAKQDDVDVAIGAAKTLMGTSPVYSTSSPALFSLLSIPPSQLTFVTFKAHSRDPYDQFAVPLGGTGSTARQRVEAARHWLRSAKLPLVTELSGATYAELMPTDTKAYGPGGKALLPPLVGLVVLSRRGLGADGYERAQEEVDKMAKAWVVQRRENSRGNGGGQEQERDVLWAWVDGDKWAGWARSMYDVKMGAKDGPKVVIADPKRLEYWSTTVEGEPLGLDQAQVFEVVRRGAYERRIKPQSSRQFLERIAYAFVDRVTATVDWAVSHPFLSLGGVSLVVYLLWLGLKATFDAAQAPIVFGGPGAPRNGYTPVGAPKRE